MRNFYHRLLALFKRKRRLRLDQIATHLPAETLHAIAREADFLRHSHQVAVHNLKEGETPKSPQAADAAVEMRLIQEAAARKPAP